MYHSCRTLKHKTVHNKVVYSKIRNKTQTNGHKPTEIVLSAAYDKNEEGRDMKFNDKDGCWTTLWTLGSRSKINYLPPLNCYILTLNKLIAFIRHSYRKYVGLMDELIKCVFSLARLSHLNCGQPFGLEILYKDVLLFLASKVDHKAIKDNLIV